MAGKKVADKKAVELQKLICSSSSNVGEAGGIDTKSPRKADETGSNNGSKAPKTPFELFCMDNADRKICGPGAGEAGTGIAGKVPKVGRCRVLDLRHIGRSVVPSL
ncbi:hypothetical protein Tcan_03194 [Toxocara canis]|uniref:Uncharacterized protein n=1 Tax=Toxocara canis TaxID=6265 RepID=A0A0B2W6B2_TOXCA|nr:hypothetical protein Tcan_03194 [Toxocara canis]